MKRLFDLIFALLLLMLLLPFLIVIMIMVWLYDFHSPFYIAPRMAREKGSFMMIKFRTMVIRASESGVNSSAADDRRITGIGKFLRRYKLDELPQLINVLKGEMSFVGPRPQVQKDADLYTTEESKILSVRPGITDLSSIVFADEGDILKDSVDPDLLYNQVIRPWKSRLALIYIERRSSMIDIKIILWTIFNMITRPRVLRNIRNLLIKWNCDINLIEIVKRDSPPYPFPPPGGTEIVFSYHSNE